MASSIKPAKTRTSCVSLRKTVLLLGCKKHRYSLNELRRTLWPLPIMGERREKNSLHCACDVRGRYSILMAAPATALAAGELPAVVVLLYYNVRRGKKRGERGMFKLRNRSLARLLAAPQANPTRITPKLPTSVFAPRESE